MTHLIPKKKNQHRTLRNNHGQKEHVFSLVVVTRESREKAELAIVRCLAIGWTNGMEFKLRRGQPK